MIAQLGETGAFEHYGTCRRDDKTVHHPSRFFDRHKVPGGPPTPVIVAQTKDRCPRSMRGTFAPQPGT